jgi:hypothetical protein
MFISQLYALKRRRNSMACFLVPAAEAIVITVVAQVAKKRAAAQPISAGKGKPSEMSAKIPFSRKLKWLTNLLWGGSVLLAFEHLWHGEVVPWFPFLTAASNPADASAMLHEMGTVGVSMAVLITVVWVGMLLITSAMAHKELKPQAATK